MSAYIQLHPLSYDLLARAHLTNCSWRAIWTSNHMIAGHHDYRSATMPQDLHRNFGDHGTIWLSVRGIQSSGRIILLWIMKSLLVCVSGPCAVEQWDWPELWWDDGECQGQNGGLCGTGRHGSTLHSVHFRHHWKAKSRKQKLTSLNFITFEKTNYSNCSDDLASRDEILRNWIAILNRNSFFPI